MIYYDLVIVTSFLLFLFCGFSYLRTETFINPVSILSVWWGMTIIIAIFNPIELNYPRKSTFILIISSYFFMNMGGLTVLKKTIINQTFQDENYKSLFLSAYTAGHIILFVVLLFFLRKAFGMLLNLDPNLYRYLVYQDAGIFGDNRTYVKLFIRPLVYSGIVIGISGLYLKNIPKYLGYLCITNSIMYSIVIVGRFNFIFIFFSLFFGFVYARRVKEIKLTKRLGFILISPILLILAMSIFRGTGRSKTISDILIKYAVWYTTGQYTALDYFLNNYYYNYDYSYSYVATIFSGVEDVLRPVIIRLFPRYDFYNNDILKIVGQFRPIGNNTAHNSMYTSLLNFYKDIGILGVVVYSYSWGAISAFIYNNFFRRPNLPNLSMLLLVTYLLIMTVIRWEPMFAWVLNSVILIILLGYAPLLYKRNELKRDLKEIKYNES